MIEPGSHQKEKLTIDIVKANVYAVMMILPVILLYGLPYLIVWHDKFSISHLRNFMASVGIGIIGSIFLYISVLIVGIVIHELIHGLTWALFAKNGFKSISFGIMRQFLTPYCHCREPLQIWQYMTGAVTPAIILGLVPAIFSIINGSFALLLFGIIFTVAAGGDLMIIYLLRKEKKNDLVQDHPTEAGCYVYRKVNSEQ
jgi:hypothetical protein